MLMILLNFVSLACPVCYVPVEHALAVMPASQSPSPILQNLTYFSDENLLPNESNASSLFGGQPSLQQRNESFDIKESMTVHCGYVLLLSTLLFVLLSKVANLCFSKCFICISCLVLNC